MNIRKGMGRVARVTAVAYWAVALAAVGVSGWQTYQETRDPYANIGDPVAETGPWEAYWKTYRVQVPDGRTIVVKAESQARASEGAHEWASANPKPHPLLATAKAVGMGLAVALLVYGLLWAVFRAIRWVTLGFMDAPAAPKP